MAYNISSMIGGRRNRPGASTYFPVLKESIAFEKAYHSDLRWMLGEVAKGARELLVPEVESLNKAKIIDSLPLTDALFTQAFEKFIDGILTLMTNRVGRLFRREVDKHTARFMAAAKRAFGIDLRGVISDEGLEDYIDLATQRNVSLIKGLTDEIIKKMEVAVVDTVLQGRTTQSFRGQVREIMKTSDKRAKLIARDQTAKLNSDLTKKRHLEAGVDSYIWSTSHDERVRSRHRSLDGKEYQYDKPTGAEDGLPPGQPIQCRCVARGIVKF